MASELKRLSGLYCKCLQHGIELIYRSRLHEIPTDKRHFKSHTIDDTTKSSSQKKLRTYLCSVSIHDAQCIDQCTNLTIVRTLLPWYSFEAHCKNKAEHSPKVHNHLTFCWASYTKTHLIALPETFVFVCQFFVKQQCWLEGSQDSYMKWVSETEIHIFWPHASNSTLNPMVLISDELSVVYNYIQSQLLDFRQQLL